MPEYPHKKYSLRTDEDLNNRALAKDKELEFALTKISIAHWDSPRVIVLGCPDKRMIKSYQELFEKYFGSPAVITVIDVVTDHLEGLPNVIKHDATEPLPNPPYDIVYSHVLLKFIETEKQWNVLENSFNALAENGIAIHIFDKEDVETKDKVLPDGWFAVPLERWKAKLDDKGIKYTVLPFDFEQSILGVERNSIRGIKGVVLVLFK